jgi:SAM-dependent methyltransferase
MKDLSFDLAGLARRLGRREHHSSAVRPQQGGTMIAIDERTIRHAARTHGPREAIVTILLKQAYGERVVRSVRRLDFRRRCNEEACRAYGGMRAEEFATINSRQSWANWRTIPRSLNARLPARPVDAIDLCCGLGDSTAVLAYYCAPGSRILGLEFSGSLVAAARERTMLNREHRPASVEFSAQSVLETFRHADGREVQPESVDLINASGAVGCHFDGEATRRLAAECARVMRPGGLATIDSGRDGTGADDLIAIFRESGFEAIGHSRSCVFDRYRHVCLRYQG